MNFKEALQELSTTGFQPNPNRVFLRVPNAQSYLMQGLRYFCGEKAVWRREYNDIAEWLTDNKGKGLLCKGAPGLGKTLICAKILPILIRQHCNKIVSVYDANHLAEEIQQALYSHLLVIDDVGIESEAVVYGSRHDYFSEIVDAAEKKGKLLIITTNLTIPALEQRYGLRTLDRLHALTRAITFEGNSLRL